MTVLLSLRNGNLEARTTCREKKLILKKVDQDENEQPNLNNGDNLFIAFVKRFRCGKYFRATREKSILSKSSKKDFRFNGIEDKELYIAGFPLAASCMVNSLLSILSLMLSNKALPLSELIKTRDVPLS